MNDLRKDRHAVVGASAFRFGVLALVLLSAMVLRLWICRAGFFYDDGMIVLRVAENIARGNGFCYNVGEPLQAATSLLWSLIAALVWKLFPGNAFSAVRALGCLLDSCAAIGITMLTMVASDPRDEWKDSEWKDSEWKDTEWKDSDRIVSSLITGLFYAGASTAALAAPSGLETGL